MLSEALRLSFFYFAIVFTCGVLFGSVRVPFLQPTLLGARYAELLEMPLMLFVIWESAQLTISRLTMMNGSGGTGTGNNAATGTGTTATTTTTTADAKKVDEDDDSTTSNQQQQQPLTPILIGALALAWLVGVELATTAILQGGWWNGVRVYFVGRDVVAGPVYGLAVLSYAVMPWYIWLCRRQQTKWAIDFDGSVEEDGGWF
ncbi:hypothetical protein PV08_00066 [Exophiala spinifera]|uniref:Uncharacterized protein n=1 Tax=Exophiala spinifera TaxID=91928 RepID=A0A0D2C7I4_9EURO|nr:uncharacterized protein PV08_00066 [Exophiala spinifera]KIW19494.1 hypothetical protein PV08_00066 [Exophiala spinifera]